jgi:hypothetical protein
MRAILAGLAFGLGLLSLPAWADDAAPPAAPGSFYGALVQAPLTEDQVKHYIEAMPDMQEAMGDAPADAAEPDAKTMTKLEEVARKHGFADFNEYNTVAGNIALVLDGIDPQTKTYVGADKLIENSIAQVNADKSLSEGEKNAQIADLQTQLKSVSQVKYESNVALVVKYYDKLNED